MSDIIAAQREARRRKITQNSQGRLNKLLGRPDTSEADPDTSSVTQPTDSSSMLVDEDQPPSLVQSSPYNLRRRSQKSESPPPSSASTKPKPVSSSPAVVSSIPLRETQTAPAEALPFSTSESHETDHILPAYSTTAHDTNAPSQAVLGEPTQASKNFDIRSVELLRIVVCVVTALLTRSVLRLGFGLFMIESIFLPFFVVEAIFIYTLEVYFKDHPMAQSKGTLVSAALMLCGIKPDLMDVYHKIMSHVAVLASDFGLYLFSFVIWHALMT